MPKLPLEQRFWSKVSIGPKEHCWPWTGKAKVRDYAQIEIDYKNYLAHRIAYELTHGPLPPGIRILHKCDNPPCCNPSHLFPGTQHDNAIDARDKGRLYVTYGAACHFAKQSPEQVEEIRKSYIPYKTTRKMLATKFGISMSLVEKIVYGEAWRHLTD